MKPANDPDKCIFSIEEAQNYRKLWCHYDGYIYSLTVKYTNAKDGPVEMYWWFKDGEFWKDQIEWLINLGVVWTTKAAAEGDLHARKILTEVRKMANKKHSISNLSKKFLNKGEENL